MPVQVSRQHQPQPHHPNHSSTSLTNSTTTITTTTTTTTTNNTSSNAPSYLLHRDSPTSSRDDGSSTGSVSMDGRQRKRLHKAPESKSLSRNPSLRSPAKPATRQTAREPKKPLITRAPDFSSLKVENHDRPFASSSSSSSSAFTNANANPNANEHPQTPHQAGRGSSNVTTFYAFGESRNKAEGGLDDPFDFQPSMNLEDVHRGIIDTEQLNSFPSPRKISGANILNARASGSHAADSGRNRENIAVGPASMLRKPSVNKFSQPQNREPREPAPREPAPRRRQSNISNLSISAPSTTYRKSTVTLEPENSIRSQQRRKPSGAAATGSLGPSVHSKYHKSGGYSDAATEGGVKVPVSARNTKAKSLQPPPRQTQNLFLTTSLTPEHYRASIGFTPRSPRSPSTNKKTGAPGSTASRRISTIPHASGLAARTISPTDARRLKRLSMLNTPPPPPSVPISLEAVRSTQESPSMIPRKSVTPSSQGTTPEPQRKSYSSGLSLSSTSTARTSVGSLQPKLALNLGSSRLPRPPQLERDDDDIPPVPPLPKNLASPLEPHSGESSLAPSYDNTPFGTFKSTNSGLFGPRKSSLAVDPFDSVETPLSMASDQTLGSDSPVGRAKSSNSSMFAPRKSSLAPDVMAHDPSEEPEMFDLETFDSVHLPSTRDSPKPEKTKGDKGPRRKRGMTMGGMGSGGGAFHMLDNKASSSSLRKKDLAPIRLPPLNLLPLSTPTIARVNALGAASDSDDLAPPPKFGGNRTPSTPMTASKASFFSRRDEAGPLNHERSMSSFHHSMPPEQDSPTNFSTRPGSSPNSSIPVSVNSRMGRQTSSPYVASLSRGVSANDHDGKRSAGANTSEPKKSVGMSGQLPIKSRSRKSQDSMRNAVPTEDLADSAPTGTSIRRKLSLSWKKNSGGKNSHAATERAEEYNQGLTPKFDSSMPPPKLPSASTWTPGTTSTPSPNKAPPFGRRKGSTGNGPLGQHDRTKSDSWGITGSPKKEKRSEEKAPAPPSKTSSILSPMTKILGSKGSLSQLRSRNQLPPNSDPNLDHDDLIAEEEMRKIASKRKNLDQAAAQLDDLKRRAGPKDRLSPQHVLRMGYLNIFEKGEIVDYKDVYFTGLTDAKKHVGDLKNTTLPNFGYDDERGDYSIIKGDHLAYRYEIVDILGKGSFGQVVRCIDHRTGGLVAIKIIRNKKRFHQQALVEVNILQKLKEWDPQQKHSLINFTQSFYFRGHLCISTELLGMNLYEFIKSNDFRGFSLKLIRRFTKQMLSSLLLLKGHRVIHCDLKPENILLAHPAHSEIKVIDFGSSCFENEKVYTYIQSRFYRSPEVILGMSYGLPIDMWSLGCILAELYTGYPIFPGENEQEQLACIMEVFGPPEKHLIEKSTRRKLFFDTQGKPRMIVSSKGRRRRASSKTLQYALKCDDEPFLDFVSRCLRWDPEKRMRPEEAMNHEFITGRKQPQSSRTRSGNYASATASSDTRRYTTYSRPLPDPPGVKKVAVAGGGYHSPMKASTTTTPSNPGSTRGKNPTLAPASKRNSTGAVLSSTLPRVAAAAGGGHRSISGKLFVGSTGGSHSNNNSAAPTPNTGGRASAHQRTGAGTSGSIRLLREEEAAMSSGGEGGRRR